MRTLLQEEDSDKLLRTPATSSPFDSSLVLTVLVLLTVLFFMAFFSLYIRRFSSVTSSGDGNSVSGAGNSPPRLHKRGGVDVSTVQSLPIVQYGGDLKSWSECSICLTEFEERETVKVIPYCRHGFHPVCIETWLSSHGSCPMCRSTQLFPAVDEVRTGTG